MARTTETELQLLITAAQLLQAADAAPADLRKRLQARGGSLLDEAEAAHAEEWADEPMPGPYSNDPRTEGELSLQRFDYRLEAGSPSRTFRLPTDGE